MPPGRQPRRCELRRRLALAGAQVAAQRDALARATAALDRAIDVLMPSPGTALYSAGGTHAPAPQPHRPRSLSRPSGRPLRACASAARTACANAAAMRANPFPQSRGRHEPHTHAMRTCKRVTIATGGRWGEPPCLQQPASESGHLVASESRPSRSSTRPPRSSRPTPSTAETMPWSHTAPADAARTSTAARLKQMSWALGVLSGVAVAVAFAALVPLLAGADTRRPRAHAAVHRAVPGRAGVRCADRPGAGAAARAQAGGRHAAPHRARAAARRLALGGRAHAREAAGRAVGVRRPGQPGRRRDGRAGAALAGARRAVAGVVLGVRRAPSPVVAVGRRTDGQAGRPRAG